jgi:hypothetical protein
MSLKNIQSLYKIMSQELPLSSLNNSNAGTPSKRSTKDGMAKSAENAIVTQKQPMYLVLSIRITVRQNPVWTFPAFN